MLYELHQFFDINLFRYISIRSLIGFFIALGITLTCMPLFIRWASKGKYQPISKYAPENHQQKASTPTMGGIVFVGATILAAALVSDWSNWWIILGAVVIASFTLLGLQDDWQKVMHRNNKGLKARHKLLTQSVLALGVSWGIYAFGFPTTLYVPFYKYAVVDMGVLAIGFWALVIVAASNAVNLTDGLDGLATFPAILAFGTLGVIVYMVGNAFFSEYLLLPKFIGVGELFVLTACFMGSLLGLLWFNAHPAQIFMGDSGSLPIGAFMGYLGIMGKSEFLLVLVGIVFVAEAMSVILQISSLKLRKKRIFKMAPLHHHYEIKGWKETKIIVRFWIVAILANLIALISLKIR